jgi:hypothetical protein
MFNAKFSGGANFTAKIRGNDQFTAHLSETILKPIGEYYTGRYDFIPTDFDQTVHINGMVATQDITIRAVPNDYGKIIWDGSIIYVR